MRRKAFQLGRREREPELYSGSYAEGLSDARTRLETFGIIHKPL